MSVESNLLYGAALAGAASAFLYARRKRWTDAALALAAGLSLAALLAAPAAPPLGQQPLVLATGGASGSVMPDDSLAAALVQLPATAGDAAVEVRGHGLREAQWRDLPVRTVRWRPAQEELLWLDFPRALPLGRSFALTVRRGTRQAGWGLQLLAENGRVLTESRAAAAADALTVQWLPPMAESMVLQARLLDKDGKAIAQGPVPLRVLEALPLQVLGRFGAPSFDTRVLNQMLADSNAILDWQTTLGKSLSRSEEARAPLTQPNLQVADAAWLERGGLRPALAHAARGVPLLVLGGNVQDAAQWQRELGLKLQPISAATEQEDTRHLALTGATLALPPAAQLPSAGGAWQALARDKDGKPWLWQRSWQRGRILWLGVRDWHRHAISEPGALGQWWQQVMDLAASGSEQELQWIDADPMPLPGLRTEICARGAAPGGAVVVGQDALRWQARSERADAACVALWPRATGWLQTRSGQAQGAVYVYSQQDWPAWQAALRQDATARYADLAGQPVARRPVAGAPPLPGSMRPADAGGIDRGAAAWQRWAAALPRWLLGLACAASVLLLWWRERR